MRGLGPQIYANALKPSKPDSSVEDLPDIMTHYVPSQRLYIARFASVLTGSLGAAEGCVVNDCVGSTGASTRLVGTTSFVTFGSLLFR